MASPMPIHRGSAGQRRLRRPAPMAYSSLVTAFVGCAPVVVDSFVPLGSVRGNSIRLRSSEWRAARRLHVLANGNVEEATTAAAASETKEGRERNPFLNILGANGNYNNNKQEVPASNGANGGSDSGRAVDDSPPGFLQRDVSPPVVDDEWEFSLEESSSGAEGESASLVRMAGLGGLGLVVLGLVVAATLVGSGVIENFSLPSPADVATSTENFFSNPTATLEAVVKNVEEMGPSGFLYFGIVYTVAEILAIPAIPLTASAGYLFGVTEGTAVVLASASIAAAVSFIIGRTLLRSYVETVLEEYPKFKKIDKAIGREGFKLMVLLRLSPIFPFALSNYLYGATSVGFWPYFFGTMIGFTPGTIAYVYTGEIGKALTLDSATASPWYVYAGGFALLTAFLKVVADVATGIIEELDEEDQ